MKRSAFLTLIFIAIAMRIQAQIPNNGFENWSISGNCLKPQGWACLNDWMGETENCYSMSRSDDHYPASIGQYSIKIENNISVLPDAGAGGMVWAGNSTGFGTDQPAFPVTGHPTSLCGYYKFIPENGEKMDIHFVLYKKGTEITGGGMKVNTAVSEWTSFKITVSSPDYAEVDSARIIMSSFDSDDFPNLQGNSVLFVDNLSFDVLITAIDESNNSNAFFHLSPNPADDVVRLNFSRSVYNNATLEIYNQIGVKVRSEKLKQNQQTLNTTSLSEGIYFVVLTSKDYTGNQKLIIQR